MKWDVFDDEDGHKSIRRRDPALRGKSFQEIAAENARLRKVVDGLREKALTIQDRYSNEENHFLTTTELLAALEDQP